MGEQREWQGKGMVYIQTSDRPESGVHGAENWGTCGR